MKRVRDSQRGKLYRAERQHSAWSREKLLDTLTDVHEFVTHVTSRVWFIKRWEYSQAVKIGGVLKDRWDIRDGRGCRSARGSLHFMILPKWARQPLVILHEMAHGLSRVRPAHGREFAETFLTLVHHTLGKVAGDELKRLFRENHVHFRPKRKGNPPSEKALAALRLYRENRRLAANPPIGEMKP